VKRLRFYAEALAELDGAAAWYEREQPGLGAEFVEAVESALARVLENPAGFPPARNAPHQMGMRHCLVRRFPYALLFLQRRGEILLIAVAHTKRSPGYWRSRL